MFPEELGHIIGHLEGLSQRLSHDPLLPLQWSGHSHHGPESAVMESPQLPHSVVHGPGLNPTQQCGQQATVISRIPYQHRNHFNAHLITSSHRIAGIFRGEIFVSSELLASLWKTFRGQGILNHTPCTRGVEMDCYFEVEAMIRVAKILKQGHTELHTCTCKATGTQVLAAAPRVRMPNYAVLFCGYKFHG